MTLLAPGPFPPGLQGVCLSRPEFPAPFNPAIFSPLILPAIRRARRLGKATRPSVVLAFGIWSLPAARAAAGNAPIVLDLAHIETATAHRNRSRTAVALLHRLEAAAVGNADEIWVVSEGDRRRLRALVPALGDRVRVVPLGSERHEPRAALPPAGFRALFVGRMSFAPNREAALFLARRVAPIAPWSRFVIVGESPPPGLRGVDVLGPVDDLAPIYRGAHAALAPVFSGSGVRNKVLEAARFGVPLVATRHAVQGLGLRPEIHYLAAESAEEFAGALSRLANEPQLGATLAAALGRHVVERFLWDDIALDANQRLDALARRFSSVRNRRRRSSGWGRG